MKLAARMKRLGTETAFEMLARGRALEAQGRSIIHLEIGEPDFDTPQNVKDAAVRALKDGFTHYGPSVGLPQARAAVARYVSKTRGVPVDPEQVVVTPGAKPVMFFAMMALMNEGDEALCPDPGFPIYESMIHAMGGQAVPIPLIESAGWSLDLDALARSITPWTKLIVLNSPHNPTGGVVPVSQLAEIARIAEKHDLLVLSDEIYSRIHYDGELAPSYYAVPGAAERTILLDGFSKTYAMTGWRAGFGVVPKFLVPHFTRLMANSASCTASFTQIACIEALEGPQDSVVAMVAEFRARRDLVVNALNQMPGVSCVTPQGAFYVFPNIRGTGFKSVELQDRLLDEAGVACLAGTAFGRLGEGYLRFSYAASRADLSQAMERVSSFLARASRPQAVPA